MFDATFLPSISIGMILDHFKSHAPRRFLTKPLQTILLSIAIPVLLAGLLLPAYAQKADIVNSNYLTITEQKYTKGDFSDTITGTIQYLQVKLTFRVYTQHYMIATMDSLQ